jgi:hypothetical protein
LVFLGQLDGDDRLAPVAGADDGDVRTPGTGTPGTDDTESPGLQFLAGLLPLRRGHPRRTAENHLTENPAPC